MTKNNGIRMLKNKIIKMTKRNRIIIIIKINRVKKGKKQINKNGKNMKC